MIAVLVTIYTAVVLVLFKLKLVKPRPYPIALTALVGIFMIGGVVVAWTLSAPISPRLVTTQYVVQLVPYVKGQVKAVYAQANQPMKRGDVLLEIDPAPYQYTVDQRDAQLKAAKASVEEAQAASAAADANVAKAKGGLAQAQASVEQAKAAVVNARASLARTKASDELAKTQEQIALNIQRADVAAISKLKVAEAVQQRQEADAAVDQAQAAVAQSEAATQQAEAGLGAAQSTVAAAEASARQAGFAVGVVQSNVTAAAALLDDARFNLAQCKMTAPADGYVVNWQVQPGTMLVPAPIAAAGTFVSTEDISVLAAFPQNHLLNVAPGDDVEMVLDPYPGRLFIGKVDSVIPASGGGQLTPTGDIPNAARVDSSGLWAVKIVFTDHDVARKLSIGSGGAAAIYTKRGKPVHIITKITIRMKKWLLYVVPA
jgi:multidrug resistance efflux pump